MSRKLTVRIGTIGMIVILTLGLAGCSNQGKSYYKAAVKSYNKGNYETAAESFAKAIEYKDDNADYYIDYGYCLIELEKYKEAESMFQKAILEKENSIVNKNNKKAYRGLGIMNYLDGNYESAIEDFNKALEYTSLNEYDVDILSYMGTTNIQLGNYEEALADFTSVIEKDAKNRAALKSRGEVNYQLGNYEDSIADYTASKEIDKEDYDVYFGLYQAYTALGDSANAKEVLEQATSLPIKDDEDKFYLAKVHYYQGNNTQALEEFSVISELGFVDSYLYMGNIYLESGDNTSAVSYYELYLQQTQPKNASFYSKLSTCYLNVKSYSKALDTAQKGLSYAGSVDKKNLLRNEIIAYEYLGDYETAYAKMQAYLSSYPEDEEAKREMEFLSTRQGNVAQGEDSEDSQKADEIVKP